jgi:hypothetical protein
MAANPKRAAAQIVVPPSSHSRRIVSRSAAERGGDERHQGIVPSATMISSARSSGVIIVPFAAGLGAG